MSPSCRVGKPVSHPIPSAPIKQALPGSGAHLSWSDEVPKCEEEADDEAEATRGDVGDPEERVSTSDE
jgi:hypothetical protein